MEKSLSDIEPRIVAELERRGFGSTLSRWIAHSIHQHGLKYTMETLTLTLYDVEQTAKVDAHNREVMDLAWSTIGRKAKSAHLPQPPQL